MPTPLKVSVAAALSLHATAMLASRNRPISTRRMASRLGQAEAHLSKVLQRLSKVGLVRSSAGPKGGFVLGKPASEISLLEVFETIEGPMNPLKCMFGKPVCAGQECILGSQLGETDRRLRAWLSSTRLSEVAHIFQEQADKPGNQQPDQQASPQCHEQGGDRQA